MRSRSALVSEMKTPSKILALVTLFLVTGCTSAPNGSGFFGWWAARGERAAAKARDAHDDARERQLEAARIEAEKARESASKLPPSPEATLTQRFTGNTSDLLAQAVPGVTAEQLAAVRQLIADLRSEDAKVVAAAEARQRAAEGSNAALSRELGETSAKLTAAETRAGEIAEKNAEMAGELMALRWAAAAGTVLTVVAGLAAVAYRANVGGMATGIARGLADLRLKDPGTADLATAALDGGLNRAEQTKIAVRVQALLAAAQIAGPATDRRAVAQA